MAYTQPHPCRCLLAEAGQEDMRKTIDEIIALMPEETRAKEAVRAERLAVCVSCGHLLNGTCTLCGCYVEARAAVRAQSCPDVPHRWEAESDTDPA